MDQTLNAGVAFLAGVVSFAAPCTLALVPAYMVYMAGVTAAERGAPPAGQARAASTLNAALFALGFTTVFVALGASLGALSSLVGGQAVWLNRVGGVLIIVFGLAAMGLLRVPAFERGFTVEPKFARRMRFAGAFVIGGAFAVSWTPCVGPILAAILVLAGTSGSAQAGAALLTAYAVGLMMPFLLAGVFSGWTQALLRRGGRALQVVTVGGGALMVALGVVVFTNLMPLLASAIPIGVVLAL